MVLQTVSSKRKVAKAGPYVLVLWGDYFDEVAATIFIATLRQAGLAVRVVGVQGLLAAGRYGLLLQADMCLSEVKPLLDRVTCLILPCSRAAVKRLENDPRAHELFAVVAHNKAKIVVHDRSVIRQSVLQSLLEPKGDIMAYGADDNLQTFVREIAKGLVHAVPYPPVRLAHA